MAKEKLKFKVSGKSIVYEGHPESRAKDLMEILAKLNVNDDIVVPTFRENIEGAESHTDEDIMAQFNAAKQARAEKKKNKAEANNSSAASPNAASPNAATEPEKPQKITLRYRGKQFSYEGLLSGKKNAVIQLLTKQKDVTQEIAVETFRTNLPDIEATDDEIWQMVMESKETRERAKAAKEAKAAAADAHQDSAGGEAEGAGSYGAHDAGAPLSHDEGPLVSAVDYDALNDIPGMSREERDDLSSFIKQVLEQPATDVTSMLQQAPRETKTSIQAAAKEEAEMQLTARTSGKFVVYCQEDNTEVTKLVHTTPTMAFEEFSSIVEKKFGRRMALYFYDGDDVIEVDDDDVLAMFLEQLVNSDPKKLRLHCTPAEARKHVAHDDKLAGESSSQTGTTANTDTKVTTTKATPYSNGELEVKEVRSYSGHTLAVYCCAFSSRGDQFVTASRDRSVRLWNVRTGSCSVMKGGHNGFVLSCDFSPKGNRVVSSSDDRTIKIWNTTSCAKVYTLKGHEDKVYCVSYSPNGDYIASASCDHTVRVWNAESGSRIATLKGHTLAVFTCAFNNKDGKYIVSGSDDRLIKIWDWDAGKEVRTLVGHIGTVWSVRYSHSDIHLISASMDHELKLWDARTGSCIRSFAGHKTPIHQAVFSMDDKYIFSCARDWSVMVWRTEDGEHVETITGHLATVYHIDIHNNFLLSSSLDDTLKLWEVHPKTE